MKHPSLLGLIALFLGLIALAMPLGAASAQPGDITASLGQSSSRASIYSIVFVSPNGRLRSRGVSFRLAGIALPRHAICRDGSGRRWGCGTMAFVQWSRIFANTGLRCVVSKNPDSDTSFCEIGGQDVATRLIESGWGVVEDAHAPANLIEAEQNARHKKIGIWSFDRES